MLDRDGRVRIEAVWLGWPLWVAAPSFDLAGHIRVHALAARNWRGDGSIQPGRCGSCGCCPACPLVPVR